MPRKKQTEEEKKEEEKRVLRREQLKKENKILRGFFIGLGIFIILIVGFVFFLHSVRHFSYRGVDFEIVKEGNLIFYQTKFPVVVNESKAVYNIYLRNDPRKLETEVPFDGQLDLKKTLVLNSTSDFNCQGDGLIAIGNFLKMRIFDLQIIKNENVTCSKNSAYTYLNIKEGNETKVNQIGQSCYNIEVNNCEIIKGTERFMNEVFVQVNNAL